MSIAWCSVPWFGGDPVDMTDSSQAAYSLTCRQFLQASRRVGTVLR